MVGVKVRWVVVGRVGGFGEWCLCGFWFQG